MNELNLYDIFKAILGKSKVIEGRFVVLSGEGSEINTNAFDQMITDGLGQITTPKKWPAALLMPPVEILDPAHPGWSRFKLKLYFLVPFASVDGKTKSLNVATNTSGHPTTYDWKDMRECAQDFIVALEYTLRKHNLLMSIRPVEESIYIDRHTKLANDKANGVSVSMSVDIYMPCAMADYNTVELDALSITTTPIHQIHKH